MTPADAETLATAASRLRGGAEICDGLLHANVTAAERLAVESWRRCFRESADLLAGMVERKDESNRNENIGVDAKAR